MRAPHPALRAAFSQRGNASTISSELFRNFFQSLGLLAVAMIAAIYSSAAGKGGDAAAAALSAVLSLMIAFWVAYRFVPRLARQANWDWLPFLSQYQLSREGWIYFGAVIVVVFAAVNTANNLLYMVLSALLAVLILSGFLSVWNCRFLVLDMRLPDRCFAGQTFHFTVGVSNEKHVFPTFSLFVAPAERDGLFFERLYFGAVRAQSRATLSGQGSFAKRGRRVVTHVQATSRYPFGFFTKGRRYRVTPSECICYPEILPKEQLNFSTADPQGWNAASTRGLGCDLYRVRDYAPSDSARHVHWKASAKTASLKTREFTADESRRLTLIFDRFGRPEDSGRFEELVSRAASMAFHLVEEGVEVEFISDDWKTSQQDSNRLDAILTYLALVEMSPRPALPCGEPGAGAVRLSLREGRS